MLWLGTWARRAGRAVLAQASSSLKRRIIFLNIAGLVALSVTFLTFSTFRQSLIEARVQSLLIQGDIIAGAIAASATVDAGTILTDPDKLLEMQAGDGVGDEPVSPLEFSINPERVAPLLRRLVGPTGTRARIYDRDGVLTLDTRTLYSRGDVSRPDIPVVAPEPTLLERSWRWIAGLFRRDRPRFEEIGPQNARNLPEVQRALGGSSTHTVRADSRGETIVSVAVPIQRQRAVKGALLLSTQRGDIDAAIASERFALLQTFLMAGAVMMVLSYLMANGIAGPVRRLADAAERVRHGSKARQEIPDLTSRSDEIGHLSGALRDMTNALYLRIEAIESFAADVAHELKNPLTSLRSAVETLPLARSEESRGRLMSIIQHDVRRLDRLITDISDASRLDAELARADSEPIDLRLLLETVVVVANERRRPHEARIDLEVDEAAGPGAFVVSGHDSRLSQVVNNLFDNARSFSPPEGAIWVRLARDRGDVVLTVEDQGPGIPPHALERVFERFYTDRPEQGFGQNSGLGLSISRQIVEAHRGTIRAANRGPESGRSGARFTIRLPAHGPA
ncbi:stimulus-sensing domain-containing protein [Enterovirga sp.]|uniref:stimulus-sensing domain-containing protein n=1 Tax=Enterovirga sp. TaxID=2026350 RepID=UPI002604098D|nr:stimulus-sensing domain-containing protein [Enterovirga sp.]